MKLKNIIFILFVYSMRCYSLHSSAESDLGRVVPSVSTIGSYSYSSATLSYNLPNTSLKLFQSPGIITYFCQLLSGTSPGIYKLAMQLNSRFGSRFCNNHYGQMILQIVCQQISNTFRNQWVASYISKVENVSALGGNIDFQVTCNTSGLLIAIQGNTANILGAFSLLGTILTKIYSFSISDSDFDAVCSTMKSSLTAASATAAYNNADHLFHVMMRPKWDCCQLTTTGSFGSSFLIPLGSTYVFALSQLTNMPGIQQHRNNAKQCLSLLYLESDINLFVASQDANVATSIPIGMQIISNSITSPQIVAFNKMYYGYAVPKGGNLSSIGPGGVNSAIGGTLFLGPISAYSLIAAELVRTLIVNNTVTTSSITGTISSTILPIAGQATTRITSSGFVSATASWGTLISNIQSRYANGANIADASNSSYLTIPSAVYNKLIPATTTTSPDSGSYTSLSLDLSGYINWLVTFQGTLKTFPDLNAIATGGSTAQTSALKQAISIILAYVTSDTACQATYTLT